MFSIADMAVAGAVALLLFGPDQLPKVARRAGQLVRDVQNTSQSFIREMERAADSQDHEQRPAIDPLPPVGFAAVPTYHEAPVPAHPVALEPPPDVVPESEPARDEVAAPRPGTAAGAAPSLVARRREANGDLFRQGAAIVSAAGHTSVREPRPAAQPLRREGEGAASAPDSDAAASNSGQPAP